MDAPIQVLIVDDNRQYREAFRRNLNVAGFAALEAENADQAMEILRNKSADVVVTDLQMRTQSEGLNLIREVRALFPTLPIIMISAVGTFDEGAMASQLGAGHVLSKARIDEEISLLYDSIRKSHETARRARRALDEISRLREDAEKGIAPAEEIIGRLREMMATAGLDAYVKSEAFELLTALTQAQMRQRTRSDMDQALAGDVDAQRSAMQRIETELERLVSFYPSLHEDTRESLRTAEYLFRNFEKTSERLDFSRSICVSYCFSVENQTKLNMRKRLTKFLADAGVHDLVRSLLEPPSNHVSLFFHRHILQTMRDRVMDFTIDNVRQTFLRILEHGIKYRPDGLKALGIIILVFGRSYEFRQANKIVRIDNPLGLRDLSGDEALRLAELLVNLQHFRNPYIHPEVSDRQALSKIRQTAIECLNLVARLQ